MTPPAVSAVEIDSLQIRKRSRADILLSLPSIIGTGFFLLGVMTSNVIGRGNAPDPFDPASVGDRMKLAIQTVLFFACYFGAAFGPLLLPLAVYEAVAVTLLAGPRSNYARRVWTFVVAGIVATCVFWGWLIKLNIFV